MKKITAALVLATSVLASGGAVAAVDFVDYSGTALSNTITVASATITLGSPVINAWYDVVPPTRQSSAAIAAGVNVATGKSFTVSDVDKLVASRNSYTYDPAGSSLFNYSVLHIGAGTLLFEFQNAIASLPITTSGPASDISNVFGFPDGRSEVPVPGGNWLLGFALLGFVGLSRRKAISGD